MVGFCVVTLVGWMTIIYLSDLGRLYLDHLAHTGAIHILWPLAGVLGTLVMVFAGIPIAGGLATLLFGHPMDHFEKKMSEQKDVQLVSKQDDDKLILAFLAVFIVFIAPSVFGAMELWRMFAETNVWKGYVPEFVITIGIPTSSFLALGITIPITERLLSYFHRTHLKKTA
jgi:hypothetical protein